MLSIITAILAQTCSAPYVCIDGDQVVGNQKVFTGAMHAQGALSHNNEQVSIFVTNAMRVGGAISPMLEDNSLTLRGRRSSGSSTADVIIKQSLSVETDCGQVYVSDNKGNVTFNAALERNDAGVCEQATDVLHRGMLVHGNTVSGSIAMQSAPGGRLTFEYSLPELCAKLPDGGAPESDGGTEFVTLYDGGTCFAYAGKHAGVEAQSSVAQFQGWQFATINPGAYGGLMKFAVHATGAFGQMNGLFRSEFATCPSPLAMTSLGQFYPGVAPGALSYAADEDKLYICKLTGWEEL